MSINSLTNAAIARRSDFAPLSRVPNGLSEIARAAAGAPAAEIDGAQPADGATTTNGVNTALQVLFGYIPTEVLTLYVAVIAAIHPTSAAGSSGTSGAVAGAQVAQGTKVMPSDWITFWIFLGSTPIIFWVVYAAKVKSGQKPIPVAFSTWPLWEMFAATLAYFAWAFSLPSTPFREETWYSAGLAGVAVLIASTVLGLLAPLFQRPLGVQ
jgi:hypothetical protein